MLIARKSIQETIGAAKKPKIQNIIKNDVDDDDDDDEEVTKVKGKRKISCLIDSDSDYENDENETENSQDGTKLSRKQSEKKIKLEPNKKKTTLEEKLKAKKDESHSPMDIEENSTVDFDEGLVVHKHQKFAWLKPDAIRDAQKRRSDDPKYDPTTLYLPDKFLDGETPVCI